MYTERGSYTLPYYSPRREMAVLTATPATRLELLNNRLIDTRYNPLHHPLQVASSPILAYSMLNTNSKASKCLVAALDQIQDQNLGTRDRQVLSVAVSLRRRLRIRNWRYKRLSRYVRMASARPLASPPHVRYWTVVMASRSTGRKLVILVTSRNWTRRS